MNPTPRLSLRAMRCQVNGTRMGTAATARRPPRDDIETNETILLEGAAYYSAKSAKASFATKHEPSAPRGR